MHDGCTFNHRYVKSNPHEVENATWMLTVSVIVIPFTGLLAHLCNFYGPISIFPVLSADEGDGLGPELEGSWT